MYDWTRFWCPYGGQISVDEGYLVEPRGGFVQVNTSLVATRDLPRIPALVLLGESGIGKSVEICRLADGTPDSVRLNLGDFGEEGTLQGALTCVLDGFAGSEKSSDPLLLLDSLDEALLGIPKAAKVITRCLSDVTRKPRLVITCRTGARPPTLAAKLKDVLGEIAVFELCGLTKADVAMAVQSSGTDSHEFLAEVAKRRAEALAANPVTLALLLKLHSTGNLPASRAEVYARGLLLLCEQSEQRRDQGSIPRPGGADVSAGQLLAIAKRLAACLLLGGHSAVFLGPREEVPEGALALPDLAGGTEGDGADHVAVSEAHIRAAVEHTGLFTGRGDRLYGFTHKSFAEYLGASFLHSANLERAQLFSVLCTAESSPRVVPQLHEAAARLADLNRPFNDWLMENEPEILLRSDLGQHSPQKRSQVLNGLLRAIRDGRLASLRDAVNPFHERLLTSPFRLLSALNFDALADELGPWITDKTLSIEVREAALDIAEANQATSIAPLCASLALDTSEPTALRIAAVQAIGSMTDTPSRLSLGPLLSTSAEEDPMEELRGATLRVMWPEHISAKQLLPVLKQPREPSTLGLYRMFLMQRNLAEGFPAEYLADALDWGVQHADRGGRGSELGELASRIAYRAWQHLDAPGVLAALARFALHRLKQYEPFMRLADEDRLLRTPDRRTILSEVAGDPRRRRLLIGACLEQLEDASDATRLLAHPWPLALPEDFPWSLEMALQSDGTLARSYAELARALCTFVDTGPWRNRTHLDLWLNARGASVAVAEAMDWPVVVILGSDEEQRHRAEWQKEKEREQRWAELAARRDESKPKNSRREVVQSYIAACDEDVRWLSELMSRLYFDDKFDIAGTAFLPTERPGWKLSDSAEQSRIQAAALNYLRDCPITAGDDEPDAPGILPDTTCEALLLIWVTDPEALDQLSTERLASIAPAAAAGLLRFSGEATTRQAAVFKWLHSRAEEAAESAFAEWVVANHEHAHIPTVVEFVGQTPSIMLRARLMEAVDRELKDKPFLRSLLPWLRATETPGAVEFAESALIPPHDSLPTITQQAAALTILTVNPEKGWPRIRDAMHARPVWAKRLLEAIAPGWRTSDLLSDWESQLYAGHLGELYVILATHFDPAEDPRHDGVYSPTGNDHAREWRSRVLNQLISLGSHESVAALHRIRDLFPNNAWLKRAVLNAENTRRRVSWIPTASRDLLAIRSDRARRQVRSADELIEIIAESARAWHRSILEDDLTRTLWDRQGSQNVWRPKDEATLRDLLQAYLKARLPGVILGREIELSRRNTKGGEPGKRIDIGASVPASSNATHPPGDEIRAVIEVKGGWNKDADDSLNEQLVERYLVEHGATHGLYVVCWFGMNGWDPEDARKATGPWKDIAEARTDLERRTWEAMNTKSGAVVRVLVLDFSLK